ncbi:MAG: hypothetical protein LBS02_04900 [Hungatella sp.]|jgi:hypothetical protein|nr:hypothetical protein [Hungatella sp.]
MAINENQSKPKQYRIYLKRDHRWVDVSKQEFDDYYRDINSYRRRMQEHGRCVCPQSKRYLCDMDCYTCPYRKAGDMLSLDYTVTDSEGNEKSWLEDVEDLGPTATELLQDSELLSALYHKLESLDPDGRLICQFIMNGSSERDSGKAMGCSRNTFTYRRDKLLAQLATDLKDYL